MSFSVNRCDGSGLKNQIRSDFRSLKRFTLERIEEHRSTISHSQAKTIDKDLAQLGEKTEKVLLEIAGVRRMVEILRCDQEFT